MPLHLTQIPLIIRFNFLYPVPTLFRVNLVLALQNRDRVYDISISHWGFKDFGLQKALDNAFPMLETLSLSDAYTGRVLPPDFVAPRLRALHLRNIAVSMGCLLLTNVMNLSSLRLENIQVIPLEYVVESIASMPHLENISISFIPDSTLSDAVMELPSTQITCVVLSRLSRLTFKGSSTYLENLLTQIATPFLQDLRLTVFLKGIPSVVRLSAFLGTLQNLKFQTAVMSLSSQSIAISCHSDQPSVAPPYAKFAICHYNAGGDGAHLGTSLLQICSAVASALSDVESLAFELDCDSVFRLVITQPTFWRTFLQPFVSVKTLTIDVSFAVDLSIALRPDNGAVMTELLPVLSELVTVMASKDLLLYTARPFSSFSYARRFAGSPVDIVTRGVPQFRHHPPSLRPPPLSWSFDTF